MAGAVEVVRNLYDAYLREDWDALMALCHPDVVLDLSRSGMPDGGVHRGHDGLRTGWASWRGVWDRYDFELEDVIAVDEERALALLHVNASSRGQGIDAEIRAGDLFTVRDGVIVRFVIFLDRDAALKVAGQSVQ